MDESMKTELDNKSIKESVREHQAFMDAMDREADRLAIQLSKVAIRTDGTITTVILEGDGRAAARHGRGQRRDAKGGERD